MAFRKHHIVCLLAVMAGMLVTIRPAFSQPGTRATQAQAPQAPIDTLIPSLVTKVASYSFIIDRNTFMIRRKFNMSPIAAEMPSVERSIKGFKSRLERRGRQMNLRSLNSGTIMLRVITGRLTNYQKVLQNYSTQLTKSNAEVKKILADSALTLQVPDVALTEQMQSLKNDATSLDSMQRSALINVMLLRNRVSISLLRANDIISDMGYLSTSIKLNMWKHEEAPLLAARPADYLQSIWLAIENALQRSYRIISIYVDGKWDVVTISLLVFVLLTVWCMMNMRRLKRSDNPSAALSPVYFLSRSVLASSVMAFFTYSPLLYANPTMSFLHANELVRLAALFYLIFPFLTRQSKAAWVAISLLWVFYALDDILLESAFGERWGLFVAGVVLTAICARLLLNRTGYFTGIKESPAAKALLVFTLIQVLMSVVFNLTGHLILAKIFGVSAIQCLVLGVTLKVFSTLVLEAIYLQSEAYHNSRFSHFINYNKLQFRLKKVLWIVAGLVWFVALTRNLTLYDALTQVTGYLFTKPRSIGNMTFTFRSVAVFICILWLSSVISGVINFFFGYEQPGTDIKRSGIGSIMLLIRLAVWSVGFLIAVAAAGIPLDRLSLMLGALGVGIGFGLQNIVNNLVSGVIIAFERPIQIGDQIEIGNKAGIVQEIGVRSSKIKSSEGSNIIIPNGDLLSQHLINWTMQDRSKRVEFIIGIPYDADIRLVNTVIQDTLRRNEQIMQPPQPVIILQAFTIDSISVRIMFWVPDLSVAGTLKSNVMIEVFEALSAAGVHLPK